MGILGVAAMAILPAFMNHLDANTRNEQRSDAVTAVQATMEDLRLQDPSSLPESGESAPQLFTIGGREYEVKTRYCQRTEFCPPASPGSRHLVVEVYLDGEKIYEVETVYTQLL
jgi:type II secretory pathway pseudopilin PulG